MLSGCAKLGMKPVCDHPGYCKNDKAALYIGQQSHIAYKPYRKINSYFPSGWSKISDNWDGLCSYTGNANHGNALCNIPTNTHAWRSPAQYNPGFICGKKLHSLATGKVTAKPTARTTAKPTAKPKPTAFHSRTFTATLGAGRCASPLISIPLLAALACPTALI